MNTFFLTVFTSPLLLSLPLLTFMCSPTGLFPYWPLLILLNLAQEAPPFGTAPPLNMTQQAPPFNVIQQAPPLSMTQQEAPPLSMTQQAPPLSMTQQAPPLSMTQQAPPINVTQRVPRVTPFNMAQWAAPSRVVAQTTQLPNLARAALERLAAGTNRGATLDDSAVDFKSPKKRKVQEDSDGGDCDSEVGPECGVVGGTVGCGRGCRCGLEEVG